MKICLPAFVLLLLSGCLLLPTARARELYVAPELAGRVAGAAWALDSVSAEQQLDSPGVEADATHILRVLIAGRNRQADPASESLLLRLRVKERELAADLRPRRAATVEIEAYLSPAAGDAQDPAILALYSETTAQSIRSYAYLSGLLERALRLLDR